MEMCEQALREVCDEEDVSFLDVYGELAGILAKVRRPGVRTRQ
jgi:hypothetical protein